MPYVRALRPGRAWLPLGSFRLNAVAPGVAMMDMGLAWFFNMLGKTRQALR